MGRDRSRYRVLTALTIVLLLAAAVCAATALPPAIWLPLALTGLTTGVGSGHYRFRLLVERMQRSAEDMARRCLALEERTTQVLAAVEESANRAHRAGTHEHAALLAKLETLTADLQVTRRDLADARRELAGVESILSARILQAARPMSPLSGPSVTEPSSTEPADLGAPPAPGAPRPGC